MHTIYFAYKPSNLVLAAVCVMRFEQDKVSQQLGQCFQDKKFSPFPHTDLHHIDGAISLDILLKYFVTVNCLRRSKHDPI